MPAVQQNFLNLLAFYLLTTLCCIFNHPSFAQLSFRFEEINTDALPNKGIGPVIQDRDGFIWVGTGQGLYRYDGFKFKPFILPGEKSLTLNSISALIQDFRGHILIATGEGIMDLDPTTEKFTSLLKSDSLDVRSVAVTCMVEDSQQQLWFISETGENKTGGVVVIDRKNKSVQKFESDGFLHYPRKLGFDEFGKLWCISVRGITVFDVESKTIVKQAGLSQPKGFRNDLSDIVLDQHGIAWITTYNEGLFKIKYDSLYDFRTLEHLNKEKGLIDDLTVGIGRDSDKNLWLTTLKGASIYNEKNRSVVNLQPEENNPYTPRDRWCKLVLVDQNGNNWFVFNQGLFKVRKRNGFNVIAKGASSALASEGVTVTYAANDSTLWVATDHKGVSRWDFGNNLLKMPRHKFYSFPDDTRFSAIKKIGNRVLITAGTNGIYVLNEDTGEKNRFYVGHELTRILKLTETDFFVAGRKLLFRGKLIGDKVILTEVLPDPATRSRKEWPEYGAMATFREGLHFFATWHGDLYFHNEKENSYTAPEIDPPQFLRTSQLLVARNHDLWIASFEGLFQYEIKVSDDQKKVRLTLKQSFNEKDGLITENGASGIFIWTMQEDLHGNIWIGHTGISKIDPTTRKITTYTIYDGLPSNTIAYIGSSKMENGNLFFATTKGLVFFHPDSLLQNLNPPAVRFTDFLLFNKPVNRKDTINGFFLERAITNLKNLALTHDQNVIGFEFSALDYTDHERNQYAYKLEGFSDDWIDLGNKNSITLTNLDAGDYVLRVKASNNNGVWNDNGASIKITVHPPLWRSWQAYTFYTFMIVLVIYFTQQELTKRRKLRDDAEQNKREAEKLLEINNVKSRFFANISHEFRTPLTLILGPIQQRINQTLDKAEKLELEIVQRNATRLLNLVNQLLDLSRLEAGMLELKARLENINEVVSFIASQFETKAQLKQISFIVNAEGDCLLYFDREKLEKVLMNLLSNAFKFTPSGGTIEVTVRQSIMVNDRPCAEIEVRDTGLGISQHHINRIFDRFYQVDNSATREFEGTGIGLSLAKDLVELHYGTIDVKSTPGEGSTFTVRLPHGKDHLLPGEILPPAEVAHHDERYASAEVIHSIAINSQRVSEKFAIKILVVEDNADLRTFMYKNLSRKFQTLLATDGQEGLDLATSEIPDIIISDLMMQKMDGLKLCEMIKSQDATSHIPVILLTARADQTSKLHGLEKGADDYIGKPFDIAELVVRIENLVANRRRMQQKYAKDVLLTSPEIKFESVDEVFLKKVLTFIDGNLDQPSLTVETLADECCLSQVQLYRKVKALTGHGPNELIRNVRLERAANMIKYNAGSIADIAYQCGFSNMSYFSKCFKEKYEKSPSDFRAQMARS